MSIRSLIEKKQAQIEKLQAQVEVLEELAAEAGQPTRKTPRRASRRVASGTSRRGRGSGRSRPGENQRKVLAVLSEAPTRLRDIAAAAELSLSATNSVLHAALKKGTAVKGTARGTYALKASAPKKKKTSKKKSPASSPRKRKGRRRASGTTKSAESATQESASV